MVPVPALFAAELLALPAINDFIPALKTAGNSFLCSVTVIHH
jgi:hypothetical protein